MSNSDTNAEKDEESKIEKRARWEAFEFRVPCEGSVRVENVSYGYKSDEHIHVVTVEQGCATGCTCQYNQYNERCKHQEAVEEQLAVLIAATPEIEVEVDEPVPLPDGDDENEDAATADEPMTVNGHAVGTDGGQELTRLENGQIYIDKTGTRWKLEQRVEHVDLADDGTEVACVRLKEVNGDGQQWVGCSKFPQLVNDPAGRFSLVSAEDDNERHTPRRSEPADFGYGSHPACKILGNGCRRNKIRDYSFRESCSYSSSSGC